MFYYKFTVSFIDLKNFWLKVSALYARPKEEMTINLRSTAISKKENTNYYNLQVVLNSSVKDTIYRQFDLVHFKHTSYYISKPIIVLEENNIYLYYLARNTCITCSSYFFKGHIIVWDPGIPIWIYFSHDIIIF